MIARGKGPILIHDPNLVNAYGLELAAQFAEGGECVNWVTSSARVDTPVVPGVERCDYLAGPLEEDRSFRTLIGRLTGPVRVLRASIGAKSCIVCWVRDPWEAVALMLVRILGTPLFVIYHNPRQLRPRTGIASKFERLLLKVARVCVHSEQLAVAARDDFRGVEVTPHPTYEVTVAALPETPRQGRTVVYVGGLRADKGSDLLLDVLFAVGAPFHFETVGRGSLDEVAVAALEARGITYRSVGGARPASDQELLDALARATVVVAPYTQVTESGSAILAMTTGTPVVALANESMRRILTQESMAEDAPDLGRLLKAFLINPWPTFQVNRAAQHEASQAAWARVVNR